MAYLFMWMVTKVPSSAFPFLAPKLRLTITGRGIGLENKLKAYHAMQTDDKIDTYLANEMLGFPAEMRTYETPLAILEDMRISKIDLLSNNPDKFQAFKDKICNVTPLLCEPNEHNAKYLTAKRRRETSLSALNGTSPQQLHSPAEVVDKKREKGSKEDLLASLKKEVALDLPPLSVIQRLRLGIVRTRWNAALVDSLFEGCKDALLDAKLQSSNIFESTVPGAFELPFAAQVLLLFLFIYAHKYSPQQHIHRDWHNPGLSMLSFALVC